MVKLVFTIKVRNADGDEISPRHHLPFGTKDRPFSRLNSDHSISKSLHGNNNATERVPPPRRVGR